ncbi:alpha/beta hydrolase [Hoeflea sp. WL0058]|uniref:Alpha/beta hydrolase n=1 Tax=Flavimaribacter sediminis TaxID=2865987 RepID=A0AAE2ZH77_9HYPH|nr:alpha/beta hydrolase [Flavimaribacter sediminis]MBW8636619.1 alpha/beta hydrolase [Flavimaribacter sediminis]
MSEVLQTIVRLSHGGHIRLQVQGSGPVVVLCHESPRSSAALLRLAGHLAQNFTCVMMDTPGFGYSDPLPLAQPEIADFALVVLELVDRLDLGPVPIYGAHTGAAIAVEAAVQSPDSVSAVILDGYAIFNETERDALLAHYLPPFLPTLDGTHVAWLWSRVRDQFTVFPWNQLGDGSRLGYGPPKLDHHHAVVTDFLLAGDAYRAAYAAAFRYNHFEPLERVQRPVFIATREDDMLFEHMERARGLSEHVSLTAMTSDRGEWASTMKRLVSENAGYTLLDARAIIDRASSLQGSKRLIETSAGPVAVRIDGDGSPVVLLHDMPGGSDELRGVAARLGRSHRAVRISLPGVDVYPAAPNTLDTVRDLAAIIAEVIGKLGVQDAPVIAIGASVAIATELPGVSKLIVVDPWTQISAASSDMVPDISPRWDGAHLSAAFWWARDYDLFKPWHDRENQKGRAIGNDLSAERLHNRFRSIVVAGDHGLKMARNLYRCDAAGNLEASGGGIDIVVFDGDPDCDALASWAIGCVGEDHVHRVSRQTVPLAQMLKGLLA